MSMYYVYLLKSINFPIRSYVGFTTSIKNRLKQHNEGISAYTAKFRPWEVVVFVGFGDEADARRFEKYL